MAKNNWDFKCPQYVDFEKELDSSGKSDIFFDAKDKSAERRSLCTPEVQGKGKGLTDSDENRLLGKMTAALSLLTPKVKKSPSRGKLFPETVFKATKATKSTRKPNTVPAPRPRSRRSKSLDDLNKVMTGKTNKHKKYGVRKSSSLNDLKTHNRLKYPITPMCLKRTIFKAKEKIARKTTEEMELEQIAKLQRQLREHLRQNEISLKKLNLRPRQCTAPKIVPKTNNLKDIKGAGLHTEKSNATEKEPKKNIGFASQATVKKEVPKLDSLINQECVPNEKAENTDCPRKPKAHSVSEFKTDVKNPVLHPAGVKKELPKVETTTGNNEAAPRRSTIYSRKPKSVSVSAAPSDAAISSTQNPRRLVHRKIMDHSGLFFVPSVKGNISKPLIFEEKNKEKPQTTGARHKEPSAFNVKDNSDKENKGCIKPQVSSKKYQGTPNAKCDINKLDEQRKIVGKRTANPPRGAPLAENVSRN